MKRGFSLIELMFAAGILISGLATLLGIFALCFTLSETAKNLTLSTNAIKQQLEDIRDHNYFNIYDDYNNTAFTISGMSSQNGTGAITVNNSDPDLLKITISVSWRQKGGRIIGADNGSGGGIALNGIRDGAEQSDADGTLKSPAKIVTLIANR